MDKNRELEERVKHIRRMAEEKRITNEEAAKLIQAIKDSLRKENKK